MIPDLEIRVLFCYSPEVLANTYNDLQELEEDCKELCSITQDIFRKNVTTYKVTVTIANTLKVNELQYQYSTYYNALNEDQVDSLAECTLKSTTRNDPSQFGFFPSFLLKLKRDNKATVLILKVFAYDVTNQGILNYYVASCVGVTESRDNTVALGRTIDLKGTKTSLHNPTVLAHEFGHLMGCRHPYNPNGGYGFESIKSNDSSHGHCVIDKNTGDTYGTIMSYADNMVLYYSNPNLYPYPTKDLKNVACGVVGVSEAYKTVKANIPKLAGIF